MSTWPSWRQEACGRVGAVPVVGANSGWVAETAGVTADSLVGKAVCYYAGFEGVEVVEVWGRYAGGESEES